MGVMFMYPHGFDVALRIVTVKNAALYRSILSLSKQKHRMVMTASYTICLQQVEYQAELHTS